MSYLRVKNMSIVNPTIVNYNYRQFKDFKKHVENVVNKEIDIKHKQHSICPFLYGGKYLLVNINKEKNTYKTFLEKQEQLKSLPTYNYHVYHGDETITIFTDDLNLMLRLEKLID